MTADANALLAELANLPPAELAAMRLRVADERKKRESRRQFWTYYPDTGPLRRDLYGKHTEFFALGAVKGQRAFIAGNRCLSYETLIDLADGTREQIGRLVDRGTPFTVLAWDGEKLVPRHVTETIRKPAEELYRITLASGAWFEASASHRVLLGAHYASVRDLRVSEQPLQASTSDTSRSARASDASRWSQILRGWMGRCSEGFRRGGERLLSDASSGRVWSPSPAGALPRDAAWSCADATLPTRSDSLSGMRRHLSSQDAPGLRVARCAGSPARELCILARSATGLRRAILQFANAVVSRLRRGAEGASRPDGSSAALFSPRKDDNRIVSIRPVGVKDIYDFTVPGLHNYLAAGCIHHNTGKTFAASYEVVCHLTGRYPAWWKGCRFTKPVEVWACGIDAKSVRDTIQQKLLGKFGQWGTGMIPFDDLVGKPTAGGVPESADTVRVQHYDAAGNKDGISVLGFKNYEQDRESYQGTQKDLVWFDEECDAGIYAEGLTRTMSTTPGQPNGKVMCTFTPLLGISDVVKLYMPGLGTSIIGDTAGSADLRGVVFAGWDDVPHLSDETKAELEGSYLPHEKDARRRGIPSMGAGAIYPVPESDIVIEPFQLPAWYKCVYGMDVGWKRTAAIWGALDEDTDTLYIWHEYYQGEEKPAVHAHGIKAPGTWIPGVIDPASRGGSQHDGEKLMDSYIAEGLNLIKADNAIAAGIYEVWSRMSSGRLKVFNTCRNFLSEFRIYRRDEKGKIIKQDDHLCDALRYLCMSGIPLAAMRPHDQWSSRPGMPPALAKSRHTVDYDPFAEGRHVGGARPQQPGAGSKSNWMPHGERRR